MANIQIPITENGTTTLATAGKYCDRNIDVNVNVQSVKTAQVTIDCKCVNADQSFWIDYVGKNQEYANVVVTGGNECILEEVLIGSMLEAWPNGPQYSYSNDIDGVGAYGSKGVARMLDAYFRVSGDGIASFWNNNWGM